ncbi:hypothetical protein Y032_0058g2936 [Ancylostoma ceylanicum]|uniref:ACT domain-containing protein n=1 Tax=Ancylostoma ceylanicum TaxID=53326 RepID=A0A016U5A0_9BILA|nr:hypothetical protein Y032_0058g2936 [Ancylostoma ceylanicum]
MLLGIVRQNYENRVNHPFGTEWLQICDPSKTLPTTRMPSIRCMTMKCGLREGIAELASQIAHMGASIKDIFHERAWIATDVFSVRVKVVAETRDRQHVAELEEMLRSKYDDVSP